MKVIKPYFEIEDFKPTEMLIKIEKAGRTCYKSESKFNYNTASKFIRMLIKWGHESVLEHEKITVRIVCDRGVSHELVRHRIASYSQESTRYCNYSGDKFGNELTFIKPCFWSEDMVALTKWESIMSAIEKEYMTFIKAGITPEQARTVLPNSLATEIVVTMNLREWRHFFKLRTAKAAHPQMREIAVPLMVQFLKLLPCVFEDIVASCVFEEEN